MLHAIKFMAVPQTMRKEDAARGEDVIVLKNGAEKYDQIGQIWKVNESFGSVKVSVSFDGEIFNFNLDELTLA